MKRFFSLVLVLLLLLSGCKKADSGDTPDTGDVPVPDAGEALKTDFEQDENDMFTDGDKVTDYDRNQHTAITLQGKTASCQDKTVGIAGGVVTISAEGTYVLSGTLDDGTILVNAGKAAQVHIVLNGVSISSKTAAPICVLSADKVVITLADKTENTLSSGDSLAAVDGNEIDAAVYSKQDLTLNGSGSLTVTSPAGHGITSKDDLVIAGGIYYITSSAHGLDGNDSVRVTGATVTVAAGKDGIHAENTVDASKGFVYVASGKFEIVAEGDGISAGAYAQIEGGSFDLVTGGGSENAEQKTSNNWGKPGGMGGKPGGGMRPGGRTAAITTVATTTADDSTSIKGIKAASGLLINGGTFVIDSADDALHANTSLTVNGGEFTIETGDDAFHADEALTITNGTIVIKESYEGLEGLHVVVTGGDISLVASDDGLNAAGGNDQSGAGGFRGGDQFGGGMSGNANGNIVISGGKLYVQASGDGIDANGTVSITGGHTTVCGPTQGDTATLDFDASAAITGGTFIGTGAAGMAQSFSDAKQGVVSLRVGNQAAGTKIVLKDGDKTLISHEPKLGFTVVILSSPDIRSGKKYTLEIGSHSETVTAN